MFKVLSMKKLVLYTGLSFVYWVAFCFGAMASDLIPVPDRKPDIPVYVDAEGDAIKNLLDAESGEGFQEEESADSFFKDAMVSIENSVESLLQFGTPPIPKSKPMPSADMILSDDNAEIYERIFVYQERGDMEAADGDLERLEDFRLRGHVLYQRYMHPTAYKTSYEELRNWLDLYADYPGAENIYKMALKRQPQGFEGDLNKPQALEKMVPVRAVTVSRGKKYTSSRQRTTEQKRRIAELAQLIRHDVRKGNLQQAVRDLETHSATAWLDPVERDLLKADIAAGYFYAGENDKAYDLASKAVRRSGVHVPRAGWLAGLAAWRRGDYDQAARHFEVTGRSPYASGWIAASGAYWAARAHMRTGNVRAVSTWLKRASEHPHTFYGLIATRALGRDFDFNWKIPTYTKDNHDLLMKTPSGARAIMLVAAGQARLAETELVRLNTKDNTKLRKALLAYAGYAGLPGLAMRLGHSMEMADGGVYHAALYPTGPWKPKEGYKVDPALIHAIMRQESRFDPNAKSRSGAKGLMQVMPKTASHVAGQYNLKTEYREQAALDNPQMNLEIGQRYLEDLLTHNNVGGDLFSLLIAYNAGPGNLAKWKRALPEVDDPLLFVESIPSSETRNYIERVLANYWMYRLREDLPTPTLNAVAAGRNAQYAAMGDKDAFALAEN
ncbi:MAG: lytic transglycosylase [Micavibrio sp.]|nr:MAG: lytic transglycosylase [Micavibrio sp.]